MEVILSLRFSEFPIALSVHQAIAFWNDHGNLHGQYMIMASGWRTNELPGEEDWFEELGTDEFDTGYFLDDFADARLELWRRR